MGASSAIAAGRYFCSPAMCEKNSAVGVPGDSDGHGTDLVGYLHRSPADAAGRGSDQDVVTGLHPRFLDEHHRNAESGGRRGHGEPGRTGADHTDVRPQDLSHALRDSRAACRVRRCRTIGGIRARMPSKARPTMSSKGIESLSVSNAERSPLPR